jgi:signal transduction histidine kinase
MSRRFLAYGLCFYLLFVQIQVSGQNQLRDSLEQQLAIQLPDTTRIDILLKLSFAWMLNDFSKGLKYAQQAVDLANQMGHVRRQFQAHRNMGLLLNLQGDYLSAIEMETRAAQYAIKLGDSTMLGLSYSNIGNYYHEMGVYDEAYYYLTRSYRLLKSGEVSHQDSLYMNIALHNLARVFKELGQYQTAEEYLKFSRRVSQQLNDKEGEAYFFDEIGDIKIRLRQYDSALYYLRLANQEAHRLLQISSNSSVAELIPKIYSKIALVYLNKQLFDSALLYYDSASNFYQNTSNKYGLAESALGRGMVYLTQKYYNEALGWIRKSLNEAQILNARPLMIRCHEQLSLLYEKKNDFQNALYHARMFQQLRDSLFSISMQQKLFRDQVRFEMETRDDIIAALTRQEQIRKAELTKQELIRNVLVVILALTTILVLTMYRSGQRRKKINQLLIEHQEEIQKRRLELEHLNEVKDKFFSIISHDLRSPINALAGILDLLDKGAIRPEEMPQAIGELRKRFVHTRNLLNNLLDWTLLQMNKLNLQPSTINLYEIAQENVDMMKSFYEKAIRIVNNIPVNTKAWADRNTTDLVIRNLLSNAMKFTPENGEIKITLTDSGSEWIISVSDTGVGMPEEVSARLFDKVAPYSTRGTANEKGTGLGLILCKEFVEKNQGRIWVESREGHGSTFHFTLPKAMPESVGQEVK